MKRLFATLMSVAVMATFTPVGEAQTSCPAEVNKAKELLAMKGSVAKGQDVQAPRSPASLAGARGQDTQAPRGQDSQAPRGQDTQAPRGQDSQAPRATQDKAQAPRGQDSQAPRGQDSQAPRGQDVQAPRGQDTQAPRGQDKDAPRTAGASKPAGPSKATALIKEAEAACKAGDMTTAKAKAEAAIAELK
jgi:hypothetical protein